MNFAHCMAAAQISARRATKYPVHSATLAAPPAVRGQRASMANSPLARASSPRARLTAGHNLGDLKWSSFGFPSKASKRGSFF